MVFLVLGSLLCIATAIAGEGTTVANATSTTVVGEGSIEGNATSTTVSGEGSTKGNSTSTTVAGEDATDGNATSTTIAGEGTTEMNATSTTPKPKVKIPAFFEEGIKKIKEAMKSNNWKEKMKEEITKLIKTSKEKLTPENKGLEHNLHKIKEMTEKPEYSKQDYNEILDKIIE